uniref:Uncharacterized protein n=1 Tax=Rhipicephalus microplus TaxID=6941 RepID=A0A6G5AFI3_RHIMP
MKLNLVWLYWKKLCHNKSVQFTCSNRNRFTAVHTKFRNSAVRVRRCRHSTTPEMNDDVRTRFRPYFCSLNLHRLTNTDQWGNLTYGQFMRWKHLDRTHHVSTGGYGAYA